jgi:uncharacterized protein (TIGR00375 family)
MKSYYADLHVHIGKTEDGKPVKISGSKNLTFHQIAEEASERKGMDIVGIIDSHSPPVQAEIERYLHAGEMEEASDGGISYRNTLLLLGSEIEVRDPGLGPAHLLAFFSKFDEIQQFTKWMSHYMKNVELSSQRIYVTARELQDEVLGRGGMMIPAHIFTPHRSVYGSCVERMVDLLDISRIEAVELGLSADSQMAGYLSELDDKTFLTNSDAHSLEKIGREYNELLLDHPSYSEVLKAIRRQDGRQVLANYGLNPRLGKYHRTYCASCGCIIDEAETVIDRCTYCGHIKLVRGVMDRIADIADRTLPVVPDYRPDYRYQVPLEFVPGIGKKTRLSLLAAFGTEMNILHRVTYEELKKEAGEDIAQLILSARAGKLEVHAGGGGTYGKVRR